MSGLIVGLVLRLPITEEFNSEAKFIATVYAEHAWEDGTHAYPAVETVAKITGFSKRTVQRYLKTLRTILLVPSGKGPRGTTRYDFPLVENADGSVRLAMRGGDSVTPPAAAKKPADSGDTQTPRQAVTGDKESGDTESGDSIVSPEPITRQLNLNDDEEGATKKFGITDQLQDDLKELGIFVSIWKDVEKRLTSGWTETDIKALIRWMRKTAKDKTKAAQGFVNRIREGTKAPKEFYPKPQPAAFEADDQAVDPDQVCIPCDDTVTAAVQKAWRAVLDELRGEMSRPLFDQYVKDTAPVHFEDGRLLIGVLSEKTCAWLESRLASTVNRLLIGILNGSVIVGFVVVAAETEAP